MNKYELVEETKEYFGRTLHRIRAVRDFGSVAGGELGGWIEKEENLSHDGDCWIYDNAKAFDNARVFENAEVFGSVTIQNEAAIYGDAVIYGGALIERHAVVSGNARILHLAVVTDNARIYQDSIVLGKARVQDGAVIAGSACIGGNAIISGCVCIRTSCCIRAGYLMSNRDFITITPIGSESGVLTAYMVEKDIQVTRGCFTGSLAEFAKAVERRHRDNQYGRSYRAAVEFIHSHFTEAEVRQS